MNEMNEMNGVSGHDSVLYGYTGQGITWANEMNFGMKHAPGAGSITRSVDQTSSVLPLPHGCPLLTFYNIVQIENMKSHDTTIQTSYKAQHITTMSC